VIVEASIVKIDGRVIYSEIKISSLDYKIVHNEGTALFIILKEQSKL
jgi:hypothetical protein